MTPLRVCGFLLMAVLTLFFLLLIIVGMVRVLRSPMQKDEVTKSMVAVDILVTDNIPILENDIALNQHVMIVPGLSILVCQKNDEDGLYIVDADNAIIRVDCVKGDIIYQVESGKYRGLHYKSSDKQMVQDTIVRRVLEQDTSLSITENIALLLLFLKNDVNVVTLQSENISFLLTIVNETNHTISVVSEFQKYVIEPGIHHVSIGSVVKK